MKISSYKQTLAVIFCLLFMFLSAAAVIILFMIKGVTFKIIGGILLGLALLCFVLMIVYARQSAKLRKVYYWVPLRGVQHIGKVYGYEFDRKYKKLGRPMAVLDVLYFDFDGNLRLIKIPTDRTKATSFPQGSNYSFIGDDDYKSITFIYDENISESLETKVLGAVFAKYAYLNVLEHKDPNWKIHLQIYNCHTNKLVIEGDLEKERVSWSQDDWARSYE